MSKMMKEPGSAITHLIGVLIAIPFTVLLIIDAAINATAWHVVSFSIFGSALILLYTASTIYHWLPVSDKVAKVLKRVDHMMIFILIAGSYTPICLIPLRGAWGWTLFGIIWGLALGGILLKALWLDAPRWLSTGIYLGMGWLVIIAFYPIIKSVPMTGVLLLIFGGVTYTVGGVIYGLKLPKMRFKNFGFHELFHLFILAGSIFHGALMVYLVKM